MPGGPIRRGAPEDAAPRSSAFPRAARGGSARRGAALAWSVAIVCLLGAGACADREEPRARPDVLLVVLDTTRADDWSHLDPERGTTPNIEALSRAAYRFTDAWSLYPETVPSHVSLFTGREVEAAGEAGAGFVASSLFTILERSGYRTYAFSGNKNLSRETIDALRSVGSTSEELHTRTDPSVVDRLLERYGEYVASPMALPPAERRAYLRHRRVMMGNADAVNAAALEAMGRHARETPDAPFLLFLNYNDAHDPYFPEPPFDRRFASPGASDFNGNLWSGAQREAPPARGGMRLSMSAAGLSDADIRRARDLHRGELAYADDRLGTLLAALERMGLLEHAVVVLTADHGELFGEHGRMAHGGEACDELLRVPLVMGFPDPQLPGGIVEARVDLRDVKPTLLAYLGIPDATSSGRSLLPLLRDGEVLAPAAPFERATGTVAPNLIEGQDPETRENLRRRLRALGYIE